MGLSGKGPDGKGAMLTSLSPTTLTAVAVMTADDESTESLLAVMRMLNTDRPDTVLLLGRLLRAYREQRAREYTGETSIYPAIHTVLSMLDYGSDYVLEWARS